MASEQNSQHFVNNFLNALNRIKSDLSFTEVDSRLSVQLPLIYSLSVGACIATTLTNDG